MQDLQTLTIKVLKNLEVKLNESIFRKKQMNRNFLISAFSMCLALTGCGGGGNDSGNNNAGQQPPPSVIGPVQSVPVPTYTDSRRLEAFQRVNELRKQMGLGLVSQNSKIDSAAQAHAHYMATYRVVTHVEEANKSGFTGERVGQRLLAAGYSYSSSLEVASTSPGSASEQVDDYVNTLYHRIPFVQYNLTDLGVGISSSTGAGWIMSVLVFAVPEGSIGQEAPSTPYVVWPMQNATIQSGAVKDEIPQPPGAGYPVTINFDPRKKITTNRFEIRESGAILIPSTVLTSSNDPNGLIPPSLSALSPRDRLKPSTSFAVIWEGTVDGNPLTVNWDFKTK